MKRRFQNLFKVLFSAAIKYLERPIKEFFIIKMDRNSPSCRSLTEVALSDSRGSCCTPTSRRDRQLGDYFVRVDLKLKSRRPTYLGSSIKVESAKGLGAKPYGT